MTYVKYKEGYMVVENEAIIKPYQYWSPQNERLALVRDINLPFSVFEKAWVTQKTFGSLRLRRPPIMLKL
jgi:hypothetical protein